MTFLDEGLALSISFLSLLTEALVGDGRLAAPVEHAEAETLVFGYGYSLDRDVHKANPQVSGPDGPGRGDLWRFLFGQALIGLLCCQLHDIGHVHLFCAESTNAFCNGLESKIQASALEQKF